MAQESVPFDYLPTADLRVDAVYRGGRAGHVGDDPLSKLLPGIGNLGGFRIARSANGGTAFVVLHTSGNHHDWPDEIDISQGLFTYFGDNRTPGHELHNTPRGGNRLLRDVFEAVHSVPARRADVPPFLVFSGTGEGRDVLFQGLAVPGGGTRGDKNDLVAVWRSTNSARFQNYRSVFTILDAGEIQRDWLVARLEGKEVLDMAPRTWRTWLASGSATALRAVPTTKTRSRAEQMPGDQEGLGMLAAITEHFAARPVEFEHLAVRLWQMVDRNVEDVRVTQASRDGGRDAIGTYRIGLPSDPIHVEFALEAKCYAIDNSVGVREVARLVSRLRHRQFGVLVTTSSVNPQAYAEVRDDAHPIVILSGADVVKILRAEGLASRVAVVEWLKAQFPGDGDRIVGRQRRPPASAPVASGVGEAGQPSDR